MRQEVMGFGDGSDISWTVISNNMHLAPDRQQHQHLISQFFTGRMLSLTPNQQCQGTEGIQQQQY